MRWETLFESRRFLDDTARTAPNRNAFQIDQDRIVFSRPFRRLQQKTQVHPLPFNAHVRNRLLHTLEVASVGRSLGFTVGSELAAELRGAGHTPDDLGYLVQAVCLAHDIGNPPFGHAGEEVISGFMGQWLDGKGRASGLALDDDLRFFDGNAQGFRILTRADGYRERGGLKLTHASLGAFLKYPWGGHDPRAMRGRRPGVKFNHFATEATAFTDVMAACGLEGPHPRHPAVWLMEAADDITYGLADLEDAVELDMVPYKDYEALVAPLGEVTAERLAREDSLIQKVALLRSKAIGRMIGAVAEAFCAHHPAIMRGELAAGNSLIKLSDERLRAPFRAIQDRNSDTLYFHPRKAEFEIGACDVLEKTLTVFIEAALAYYRAEGEVSDVPAPSRQALSLMQDYHPRPGFSASETIRCAVDFVAGMTDNYAAHLAARLRGL
ncbi:dNTP triphosphohydrolase [Roseomonas sp. GC11]|uniref:dGTP triphosphohydrolase n=1 Tax=Roseomonas sp. GC11 TaxID=2950546 RepID=UPI00210970F8|nr:dNTP triphosphohydrolase [Roseomonas sp. GC11]MCQ4159612.1 dNTP triphosphohydrolase [Roseomonas sp. GC11]